MDACRDGRSECAGAMRRVVGRLSEGSSGGVSGVDLGHAFRSSPACSAVGAKKGTRKRKFSAVLGVISTLPSVSLFSARKSRCGPLA